MKKLNKYEYLDMRDAFDTWLLVGQYDFCCNRSGGFNSFHKEYIFDLVTDDDIERTIFALAGLDDVPEFDYYDTTYNFSDFVITREHLRSLIAEVRKIQNKMKEEEKEE